MLRLVVARRLGLLGCTAARAASPPNRRRPVPGPCSRSMPAGRRQGLVFLFSDVSGWNGEIDERRRSWSTLGMIVAPVDLRPFLERQDALGPAIASTWSATSEEASRRIQAARDRGRYLTPIVAGTGMGAAVAYAAMAQAPDATLAGAASDGFATRIATKHAALRRRAGQAGSRRAASSTARRPCPAGGGWPRPADDAAAARLSRPRPVPARRAWSRRSGRRARRPPGRSGGRRSPRRQPSTLAGLPLIELPVTGPGKLMAVIYSGDGGWRDIDKEIAGRLQAKGIPVVGVDSLRYFWSEKPPDQVAARPRPDHRPLPRSLATARRGPDRLLVRRRRPALRLQPPAQGPQAHVRRLSLLGLSRSADLEIHVTGWLGVEGQAGRCRHPARARPPAAKLIQCFYGDGGGGHRLHAPRAQGCHS